MIMELFSSRTVCFCCSSEIIGIATILSPILANCSGILNSVINCRNRSGESEPKLSSVSPVMRKVPATMS